MDKEIKTKLTRCLLNAFYTFGITLTSGLAANLADLTTPNAIGCILQTLLAAGIAFGTAFFIAYEKVFKDELKLTLTEKKKLNKKGKINNSAVLLF